MPQDQENIEARLCAYIDGELDSAERSQLEKTLRSNPEHARLMEDLLRMRGWVKELPRVPAPSDLAETVQAHMERGMLLDRESGEAAQARYSSWPRVLAAAAILLLAAGLGGIIYWVLPTSHPTLVGSTGGPAKTVIAQNDVDGVPRRMSGRDERTSADASDESFSRRARTEAAHVESRTAAAMPATRPADQATWFGANTSVPSVPDARDMANANDVKNAQKLLTAEIPKSPQLLASAAANAPVYLVVHTNDLSRTNQTVANYLTSNGIACQDVPDAAVINNMSGLKDNLDRRQIDLSFANPSNVTIVAQSTLTIPDTEQSGGNGGQKRDDNNAKSPPQNSGDNAMPAPTAAPGANNVQNALQQNGGNNLANNTENGFANNNGDNAKGAAAKQAEESTTRPAALDNNANSFRNSSASRYRMIFARMDLRQAQAMERELKEQTAAGQTDKGGYAVQVNVVANQQTAIAPQANGRPTQEELDKATRNEPTTQPLPPATIVNGATSQPALIEGAIASPDIGVLIVLDAETQVPLSVPATQPQTQPAEK